VMNRVFAWETRQRLRALARRLTVPSGLGGTPGDPIPSPPP
jgi:hypothetical protein